MALRENGILVVTSGKAWTTLTVSTTAVSPVALTFPAHELRRTVIQTSQAVRWSAVPGSPPTATTGLQLKPDFTLVYDGPASDLLFIKDSTASADAAVTLHYFGL